MSIYNNKCMNRNYSQEATILSLHISGENNKSVCFISPEEGICYATLFGGSKSKLKSLVCPYNNGKLFLYKDQSKNTCKITDFDVKKYHPSFRENLFKSYAANFVTEIIIKTKCAGSPKECYTLLNGLLDGMDLSTEYQSRLGLIRFLWRYLSLLGIQPQTQVCPICGKSHFTRKIEENGLSSKVVYSEGDNGFICESCTDIHNKKNTITNSSLTYLEAINNFEPRQVRSIPLSEDSLHELRELCFYLTESSCCTKLKSLEIGIGIL